MQKSLCYLLVAILTCLAGRAEATIINIADFNVSAFTQGSGSDPFAPLPNGQPGYFTVGIGDFDNYEMFRVHSSDIGQTLSYWNGPPILPGTDTGDYFIRIITGYKSPDPGAEMNSFSTLMPITYGLNLENGFGIHHTIVANPRLDDYIIKGIYLDVIDSSTNGTAGVSTRLYADADVVPEPATFILCAIGIAATALLRRRCSSVGSSC